MGCSVTGSNNLNKVQLKKRETVLKVIIYAVAVCLTLFSFSPFITMLWGSFKYSYINEKSAPLYGIITKPGKTFKGNFLNFWSYYKYLFIGLKNSLLVSFGNTILSTYFSALTAYALTAYEWKLRRFANGFIMVAMMLPTTIANMGIIQTIYRLGLTNKLFVYILPAIATPLTVFFMKMYLESSFSNEIVQSARIEGAGEFRIFNQIVLPIMKPAIATQAIFTFATSWSDTFLPSLTLVATEKKTLPLMFSPVYFLDPNDFIVALALSLPPILVFAFLSKHIIEGITLGSVKN